MRKTEKKNLPKQSLKKQNLVFSKMNWLQLAVVLVFVFIIYTPLLNKEFLNYDDSWYINLNPFIHPFSSGSIGKIFSEFYGNQYSPIPTVFLGILNLISGDSPYLYNLSSIFLHLINVCLVCWLVYQLSSNSLTGIAVALLFGVCPLQVESIGWASAVFKTCFYSAFFLTALISYTYYLQSNNLRYLIASFVLLILSFLSKEQALVLVLPLLCIDFLKRRNLLSKKVILEKLPFLILAIAFGIITIMAARSNQFSLVISHFTFSKRILYACYALGEYVVKLFIPYQLSAFYAYPDSGNFSFWFYLHPLIIAGLILLLIRTAQKNKNIAFGILFFLSNILFTLALQIVSARPTVMADRYVYISSIGIFYLAGEVIIYLRNKKLGQITIPLLGLIVVFFSISTYNRCKTWKNGVTLWSDVIKKDQTIPFAYYNRAIITKKTDEAFRDYSRTIELDPTYTEAYYSRGIIFTNENKPAEAIADFSKAIELKPDYVEAYINRGNVLRDNSRNEEALNDYNKAIELKPDFSIAYFNRGTLFLNQRKYNDAIVDLSKAITLKNDYAKAYYNRGLAEYYSDNKNAACSDFEKATTLGFQMAADIRVQFCK